MKKTLYYAVAAILLGTVTMFAPAMLLRSIYYDRLGPHFGEIDSKSCMEAGRAPQSFWTDDGAKLDRGEALERVISPSNLRSAGLMLVPSFLLALGVAIYLKKRIF